MKLVTYMHGFDFMGEYFCALVMSNMHIMSCMILPGSTVRVFMPKRVSKYLVFFMQC